MDLFKKKVKDELEYEDPSQVKGQSLVEKIVKNKFFIPAVAIIVLLILVKILLGVFSSQTTDLGYYETMSSIFTNELGSFSYTFMVETGEKGTIIKENVAEDFSEIGSGEELSGDSSSGSGREFVDWNKYAEVKAGNWQYPIFKVTIEGTTMSVDPLVTNFTVDIATPSYNNKFTEVTARDDMYYFDVESMYNWLNDSKDSYLMSLASELPRGSKWLEIPASEFAIPSRYAENGDEQELSEAHSLKTLYKRFLVALKVSANNVSGSMGDRGLERKKDVVLLSLTGDDAAALVSTAKNYFSKSGDLYDAIINNAASQGLYNESQQKQAQREKDNFVMALNDMATAMQLCKASDLKLQAAGQVRTYTNGYGNSQIEGAFRVQWASDTTDYVINFVGVRSGDQRDIVVPDGSKTRENVGMYLTAFNKTVDYFNFTPIKTEVKLNINPDTISESVLEKFIKLVNDTGSAGYWVTRDNVGEFIEKYYLMDEVQISSPDDMRNFLLVEDLVAALEKVVPRELGNGVAQNPSGVVDEPVNHDQFPDVDCEIDGAEFHFKYDKATSNHNLFVLDCEVLNRTESDVTINCKEFVLHDLLASIYPANNETLIRNYDNTFDMSLLLNEVTIPSNGLFDFKVYFMIADDAGHSDLFYGETQLGAVIQY